jgi:hypothetical protein
VPACLLECLHGLCGAAACCFPDARVDARVAFAGAHSPSAACIRRKPQLQEAPTKYRSFHTSHFNQHGCL